MTPEEKAEEHLIKHKKISEWTVAYCLHDAMVAVRLALEAEREKNGST